MANKRPKKLSTTFWVAVVSAVATIIVTAITVIGPLLINTQQVEAELQLTISELETRIAAPTSIPPTIIVTQLVEVTPTVVPISTPPLYPIDDMEKLSNWDTDFCDDECGKKTGSSASSIFISLVSGQTNNAIEILFDVRKDGWLLMTRNIDAAILSRTNGISFSYKGTGALNSIELKLLARYPGDKDDTAFGASWEGVTDTGNNWVVIEAPYSTRFTCWWPEELCEEHRYTPHLTPLNIPDLTVVKRIDIAISNKSGDTAGLGRVAFDNIVGIP